MLPVNNFCKNSFRLLAFLKTSSLLSKAEESAIKVLKRDSASASVSKVFSRISPIISKFSPKACPII